jgi:hypothetical protein
MFGRRPDTETLLRHLEIVAFAVLITWSLIGLYGTLGGLLEVNRPAAFRFLAVVLLLIVAHNLFVRVREHQLRQLPPDERYGFTERSGYDLATGSSHPQG